MPDASDNGAANSTETLEGVWIHPAGSRAEIHREGAVWRVYLYMWRRGGQPGAVFEYDTETDLRDAIRRLEEQGNRRDDARPPDGARSFGESVAKQWSSPGQVIGAILLFVVILLVGIAVLS